MKQADRSSANHDGGTDRAPVRDQGLAVDDSRQRFDERAPDNRDSFVQGGDDTCTQAFCRSKVTLLQDPIVTVTQDVIGGTWIDGIEDHITANLPAGDTVTDCEDTCDAFMAEDSSGICSCSASNIEVSPTDAHVQGLK